MLDRRRFVAGFGHEGTLAGRLTARDGDWLLDGSFTAPWRYAECK